MKLWLLDLASGVEKENPIISLWLKGEDGSTWLLRREYIPSFYVIGDLEKAASAAKAEGLR